jgi:cold shock CspA family protein
VRLRGELLDCCPIRGYGWTRPDTFVHVLDVDPAQRARLRTGAILEYELARGPRGARAVRVRIIEQDAARTFAAKKSRTWRA